MPSSCQVGKDNLSYYGNNMKRLTVPGLVLSGIILLLAAVSLVHGEEKLPVTDEGYWERSRKTADQFWKKSVEITNSAWENTLRFVLEGADEYDFARIWNEIVPLLQETLALEDRQESLPESSWFREDRLSNQQEINELLDEAVFILSISPLQRYRDRIRELEAEINSARQEIAESRTRRVAAPKDSLWQETVAEHDREIAERQEQIQHYRRELDTIKQEFSAELKQLGLILEDEQLEFLLSTVVGDNLIEMGGAFDNVKSITAELENLVETSGEDLQSARRYYGMYVILLKTLDRMHSHLIEAVQTRYLPQIRGITAKTDQLTEEARRLKERSSDNHHILTANLEALALTRQAATLYHNYLIEQARKITESQRELDSDIATAWNTYETVKVSGEMVSLMQTSQLLLQNLFNRQVPALRPFQNLEMQREFEKLTAQLRGNGISL